MRKVSEAQFNTRTRTMYQTCKRRAGGQLAYTLADFRDALEAKLKVWPLCRYCNCALSIVNVSADHSIPIGQGGSHKLSNLEFICRSCNKSKGDMLPSEYDELIHALNRVEQITRNFTIKAKVITALKISNSFRQGAMRRARSSSR